MKPDVVMMIPLVNSRCEIDPMISLTAAMSTLWCGAYRLAWMATRPPTKGVLVHRDQVDAPVSPGPGTAHLVELGDRLAEPDEELLELVPVEVQQVSARCRGQRRRRVPPRSAGHPTGTR